MENGRAGKVKKKRKEAEDMEQELLQEIASYWGTRAEGYSEVNEKELAGSQREAWLHVLEEQFPEKKKEEMKILDIGTGPGFFPMILWRLLTTRRRCWKGRKRIWENIRNTVWSA